MYNKTRLSAKKKRTREKLWTEGFLQDLQSL